MLCGAASLGGRVSLFFVIFLGKLPKKKRVAFLKKNKL